MKFNDQQTWAIAASHGIDIPYEGTEKFKNMLNEVLNGVLEKAAKICDGRIEFVADELAEAIRKEIE